MKQSGAAGLACGAGVLGALGVGLASVAAHQVPDPALALAANFLIMHATAVLALSALAGRSPNARIWWRTAAWVMVAGAVLFCGDIAARKIGGFGLFPMAAPAGGIALISSWVMVTVAAALDWRRAM